jgi:hypothetical protein
LWPCPECGAVPLPEPPRALEHVGRAVPPFQTLAASVESACPFI